MTYLPSFKPSTTKPVVCAALVRLEGIPEPMFLYFDAVKNHTQNGIFDQIKLHWTQNLCRSEPLPEYQVVASQEFPVFGQDIGALAQWLKSTLARASAF